MNFQQPSLNTVVIWESKLLGSLTQWHSDTIRRQQAKEGPNYSGVSDSSSPSPLPAKNSLVCPLCPETLHSGHTGHSWLGHWEATCPTYTLVCTDLVISLTENTVFPWRLVYPSVHCFFCWLLAPQVSGLVLQQRIITCWKIPQQLLTALTS